MRDARPQAVFLAAARVGGIHANDTRPGDFLYDNLADPDERHRGRAHSAGVEKLLFLGSSCIYPRLAPQPITEDALLTGPLEPTNEWYAVAKIAGIKLVPGLSPPVRLRLHLARCRPTSTAPATTSTCMQQPRRAGADRARRTRPSSRGAPTIEVWGTGTPRREFLLRRRLRRRPGLPDEELFGRGRSSMSAPART